MLNQKKYAKLLVTNNSRVAKTIFLKRRSILRMLLKNAEKVKTRRHKTSLTEMNKNYISYFTQVEGYLREF